MGEIRIVGPGKTRGYPYRVCKKKVSHSLMAVKAVGVRGQLYLGYSICNAEPIPLPSLLYPSVIQKRTHFLAGLTERIF